MHGLQQLQSDFEVYLNNYAIKQSPERLYDACKHILSIGGKRIRPVAVLMANNLFGEISSDAWHAALAVELFHNFTLIHDDIMDNAPLRRGKSTVHEQWDTPTAILSGDVMCFFASQEINKISTQYLHQALEVYNATAIEVCEGQQMDMDFETRNDVRIEEYIEMIALKTSVLLACSCKLGAIVGGATSGAAQLMYDFGKNLGISFQLKDDYLDAFGDPSKVGKQVGGDILSNKKTFLLLKAYELCNDAQRAQLDGLIADNAPNKVEKVLELFAELNIAKHTMQAKEHYSTLAFEALEKAPTPASRKQELQQLATYLLQREG
jgi:geranylgeranyl diphosphate synthase, type II